MVLELPETVMVLADPALQQIAGDQHLLILLQGLDLVLEFLVLLLDLGDLVHEDEGWVGLEGLHEALVDVLLVLELF